MSEIFQMQSVPILNIADFYEHFDILDILQNREAFADFVKGHFRWNGSINLHHLDVVLKMTEEAAPYQMNLAEDYWAFQGTWSRKLPPYSEISEYQVQAKTADFIYQKYSSRLSGNDSKIIMLTTAAVLLADKDENALCQISAVQLKKAYDRAADSPASGSGDDENIVEVHLDSKEHVIMLHAFDGTYRFFIDASLQPSREQRMQTYLIQTDADVKLDFYNRVTEKAGRRRLLAGERIYCLVLNGVIIRILPNSIVNGNNIMTRKPDGIYINDRKYSAVPPNASSFAVSSDRDIPQYIYVRDGHIHYENYDHLNGGRKVPQELAVISEVRMEGNTAVVIRNDGKIWDGFRFC